MSFILTEEQEELLALVRKFSEKEILPYAHQMDVEAHFVPGLIQKIADLGFMGINVPEEYGGVGADEVTKALVIMEFAKYDASVAELLAVHTLSSDIILKHGTPEQKDKGMYRCSRCFRFDRTKCRFGCGRSKDKGHFSGGRVYH